MGDIVNLNQVRKAKARDERQQLAEENRAKFGRTKAEKDRVCRLETKADRELEGHRRNRSDSPESDK